MLLAEANQWPDDAVRLLRDRKRMSHGVSTFRSCRGFICPLHMEDRYPLVDILDQTPDIPEKLPMGDFSCVITMS